MKERLRKRCRDCGKRGNWPKKLVWDTCEDCTALRLRHDAIRATFFERCELNVGRMCDPQAVQICSSCAEYFASETHMFFINL